MATNITLYMPSDKEANIVRRASECLEFYEHKSLSQFVREQAESIVKKYDGKLRGNQ